MIIAEVYTDSIQSCIEAQRGGATPPLSKIILARLAVGLYLKT